MDTATLINSSVIGINFPLCFLKARSPTLQRIFDTMIADGVWEFDDLDKESSITPPTSPEEDVGAPVAIEQGLDVEISNRLLPELTLTLNDPEGTRFDELLYWVSCCQLFSNLCFFISTSFRMNKKRLLPYCLVLLPRLHNPIVAEIIGAN